MLGAAPGCCRGLSRQAAELLEGALQLQAVAVCQTIPWQPHAPWAWLLETCWTSIPDQTILAGDGPHSCREEAEIAIEGKALPAKHRPRPTTYQELLLHHKGCSHGCCFCSCVPGSTVLDVPRMMGVSCLFEGESLQLLLAGAPMPTPVLCVERDTRPVPVGSPGDPHRCEQVVGECICQVSQFTADYF